MKRKIKLAILFGGRSAEHEVSIRSMKNVMAALNKNKYEPVPIYINKSGHWLLQDEEVTFLPGGNGRLVGVNGEIKTKKIDVVFPILHGPFGEDGTVQGLLKLAEVPFVGAGVLGSAIGMDKGIMKELLKQAGLPIGEHLSFISGDIIDIKSIIKTFGLPLYVKPANLGSSVGVSKVKCSSEFKPAIKKAFEFDKKIIVEQNIQGREIECAVLGNEKPKVSLPGEIVCHNEYYSYEAKYLDENGAILHTPAKLSRSETKTVQFLALKVYKTLNCAGLGRVDFFLQPDGNFIVNEINTIPGFTSISMFPRLWRLSGLTYSKLIDRLIELAIDKFNTESKLKTTYTKT